MGMVHTILILGHAVAGLAALVFGCLVLRPPPSVRSPRFRIYLFSLTAMFLLVVGVVAVDWVALGTGQRVTFALLLLLGGYTVLRGVQARRALQRMPAGWRDRYVDHVGFTVISLFDGFAIVGAIDLGAPLPIVLAVGALGVVTGILAINRVKKRLTEDGPLDEERSARAGAETRR